MAVGARRRAGEPQRHLHALGGFTEVQLGLGLQVVASARPAGPRLLGRAPAEQPAEQIPDVGPTALAGGIEQVVEVELDTVGAGAGEPAEVAATEPASAAVGEQPACLVVLTPLFLVGQDIPCLADGLVLLVGGGVARVAVRVVLRQQLSGDPLDLLFAGIRRDAQFFVEVLLDPLTLNHAASPPHPSPLGVCCCPPSADYDSVSGWASSSGASVLSPVAAPASPVTVLF